MTKASEFQSFSEKVRRHLIKLLSGKSGIYERIEDSEAIEAFDRIRVEYQSLFQHEAEIARRKRLADDSRDRILTHLDHYNNLRGHVMLEDPKIRGEYISKAGFF